MSDKRTGEPSDLGVFTAVHAKLPQDRFTDREGRRPGSSERHDESNHVLGLCGSMRERMRSVPCLH
jgi:hypothetical protein